MNADIWAGIFIGQAMAVVLLVGAHCLGYWLGRREWRRSLAIMEHGREPNLNDFPNKAAGLPATRPADCVATADPGQPPGRSGGDSKAQPSGHFFNL